MMKSSIRRNGWAGSTINRTASNRHYGRITKQDIREAGLRRWDGRARITTDWVNIYHDPELCFPDGNVLIYLREPGQSSRGPAFRVHKEHLAKHGFHKILDRCIERAPVVSAANCVAVSCTGCNEPHAISELYIPAPQHADMDTTFDHHITTRNFFAWLYSMPLAGRALGWSLVALKDRIDFYRPETSVITGLEVVSYAESQGYLDFRECLDHALAALLLAEVLKLEDLWVDSFTHCVGMRNRGLHSSVEYHAISEDTKDAIDRSSAELELRLEQVNNSVAHFFEYSLSGNALGLPEIARDHFDRFRSWLHGFYIEQFGFWPPVGFHEEAVQHKIYTTMYADFRNLYHHLADPKSTTGNRSLSSSGGVCALQNTQEFDRRNRYEPLPMSVPLMPTEPDAAARPFGLQRRKSWNPVTKRRIERDNKRALRMQALISASNRDWAVMECLLVRRFSEFEVKSITDDSETISMGDGRKVRWILVYAILQTLISVMQAPAQVRNTDALTYLLCCHAPKAMPWKSEDIPTLQSVLTKRESCIEPDIDHLKTMKEQNDSSTAISTAKKERRLSLPTRGLSISRHNTTTIKTKRSSSLRLLMTKRASDVPEVPEIPKSPAYCEILVQGYGNGLNETTHEACAEDNMAQAVSQTNSSSEQDPTPKISPPESIVATETGDEALRSPVSEHIPDLTPTTSTSVSRESSNASHKELDRFRTNPDLSEPTIKRSVITISKSSPTLQELLHDRRMSTAQILLAPTAGDLIYSDEHQRCESREFNRILDEKGHTRTVHINTSAWDQFLGITGTA